MDIFTINRTDYTGGKIITGIDKVTWTERYDKPGDFKIIGDATPQLQADLQGGTLISHPESTDIMMVQDQLIDETKNENPKLEITGTSIFGVAMENRVPVTKDASAWVDGLSFVPTEYSFTFGNTWNQIVGVIYNILQNSVLDPDENLPNFEVGTTISGLEEPQRARTIKKGSNLLQVVTEMLTAINAGLRVERPNIYHSTLQFIIHKGDDKTPTVQFQWAQGDVEKARYFWSNRNFKNSSYVYTDSFTMQLKFPGASGLGLRYTSTDASDWKYGPALPLNLLQEEAVRRTLFSRGRDDILKYPLQTIMDATIAKTTRYEFGKDYRMGDLVYVVGNYGMNSVMRVTEYARTMDETGDGGYPTLSALPTT